MIGLNTLSPAEGAKHRKKIVGRGESSGHGKTSTRGHKGQKARSGDGKMSWFEGGQMSIVRRTPKRGFSHAMFRKEYEIVNLSSIEAKFDAGTEITKESLKKAQSLFGLTSSDISSQKITGILKGLSGIASNGLSAEGVTGIMSSAGVSSSLIGKIAGPLGIIVTVLQSIYGGIKAINSFMENSMQEPIKM